MTQEELTKLLANHKLWLETEGMEGQQANFDNNTIDQNYNHESQSMSVRFHKGGGLEAVGGTAYVNGKKSTEHRHSHFTNLDFYKADLRGAIFSNSLFYKCDMSEVNFSGCNLSQSKFAEVNLSRSKFGGFFEPMSQLSGVTFIRCNLTHNFLQQHDLSESELSGTDFSDSNMIMTNFSQSTANGSVFKSVGLSRSNFSSCNLSHSKFIDSDMSSADLSLANLKLSIFENTNISGVKSKFKGFFHRVKEAFGKEPKPYYVGCRMDAAYGNESLKKEVREEAYVEEFAKARPRWYKLWLLSSDCGRSMRLWSIWSTLIALTFALVFYKIGIDGFVFNNPVKALVEQGDFFPFVYYSVVTFTTLGFGDITPVTSFAMTMVIIEVIIGFVSLGLLISILANKVASRG